VAIKVGKERASITLKDQANAKAMLDAMTVQAVELDVRRVKSIETVQKPGDQKMQLACWQNTANGEYGCGMKDPAIGWPIIGGEEYSLPNSEKMPFRIKSRRDKDGKAFFEVIVARPAPKE